MLFIKERQGGTELREEGLGAGRSWAEAGAGVESGDVTQLGTQIRNESRDLGSNNQPRREELAR